MEAVHTVALPAIVLVALIFSGCAVFAPGPPEASTPTETLPPPPAPTVVDGGLAIEGVNPRDALDAVLVYLTEEYSEQGPSAGLTWVEEDVISEASVASVASRYTAGEWAVVLTAPVVALEGATFRAEAKNQVTGFS